LVGFRDIISPCPPKGFLTRKLAFFLISHPTYKEYNIFLKMDSRENKGDYRRFIISRWVSSSIETFKKPSVADLEIQSRYYIPIINEFIPHKKDIDILEIGCGFGGFIYTLKKLGYLNIDAIDIIPECCEFVSQKYGLNVECIDAIDFFSRKQQKI